MKMSMPRQKSTFFICSYQRSGSSPMPVSVLVVWMTRPCSSPFSAYSSAASGEPAVKPKRNSGYSRKPGRASWISVGSFSMPQPPPMFCEMLNGRCVNTMPPGLSMLPVRMKSDSMACAVAIPPFCMSTATPQKQFEGFFSANRRAALRMSSGSSQQILATFSTGNSATRSLNSSKPCTHFSTNSWS